jgi:RNA polymerase sigma-70 factor, ECF subfamily
VTYEDQPKPAAASDAELVARAQRGEEGAFEALYHAHKRLVFHVCLRMIGTTADAEELTQEAFLQVFRKIHTFRGESTFSTWLRRVTMNLVLMRLRKGTVKEVPIVDGDDVDQPERPPREYGAADPVLAGSIDRMALERAVGQLPPGYRQMFELHDVLGFEHNEIAPMLGCSIGNSKSQLHKARLRLRKILGAGLRGRRRRETPMPARPQRRDEGEGDACPACNEASDVA